MRFLLLSPSCVSKSIITNTITRIKHFAALTGGVNLAIVCLLHPPPHASFASSKKLVEAPTGDTTGVFAYSTLQSTLFAEHEIPTIPILPLAKVKGLADVLSTFVAALEGPSLPLPTPKTMPFDLLQLCTVEPPMDRQTAFLTTDVFPNLRELAAACVTTLPSQSFDSPGLNLHSLGPAQSSGNMRENEGRLDALHRLVGPEQAGYMMEFWTEEFVAE